MSSSSFKPERKSLRMDEGGSSRNTKYSDSSDDEGGRRGKRPEDLDTARGIVSQLSTG